MRQADLAKACGVSVPAVSQWENGDVNIRPEHLLHLADVLQVSVRYLVTGKEDKNASTSPPPDSLAQSELDLIQAYALLTPDERDHVWFIIDRCLRVKHPDVARYLGARNLTHQRSIEPKLVRKKYAAN